MQSLTEQVRNGGGRAGESRIRSLPEVPGSSLIPVTAWQLLQEPLQLAVASAAGETQATTTVLPLQTASRLRKGAASRDV